MKNLVLIALFFLLNNILFSQIQRMLFVTDYKSTPQVFRGAQEGSRFANYHVFENYNLLAAVLGDDPNRLLSRGQTLVEKDTAIVSGVKIVYQPFAYRISGSTRMKNLALGNNLSKFLSNPLGEEQFHLSLPFNDKNVALSKRSAFLRIANNDQSIVYHTAIDFDHNLLSREPFEVVAVADGIVSNSVNGSALVLLHTTPMGKEFLTIYQHVNSLSKRHFRNGDTIRRGQRIGVIDTAIDYPHLHFAVAVKGPAAVVEGQAISEQWYLIDPFGVYDYRRNRADLNNYNYLPSNNIRSKVNGVINSFVFITNPIYGSFYYNKDTCMNFDPSLLKVRQIHNLNYQLYSGECLIEEFKYIEDAGNTLQMILQKNFTQFCAEKNTYPPRIYYYK